MWLQQRVNLGHIEVEKIKGTENPADMNTKGLNGDDISRYTRMLNMEHQEGRSNLAPEVHQILHGTGAGHQEVLRWPARTAAARFFSVFHF